MTPQAIAAVAALTIVVFGSGMVVGAFAIVFGMSVGNAYAAAKTKNNSVTLETPARRGAPRDERSLK